MNRRVAVLIGMTIALCACGSAPKRDLDRERLALQWDAMAADSVMAPAAASEISRRLETWQSAPSLSKTERADLAYALESQIKAFAAQVDLARARQRLVALDSEEADIRLEAAKRDAERAHLDAEKARLQSAAQAEEADRMRKLAEEEAAQREALEQEAEFARMEADAARTLAATRAREVDLAKQEAALMAQESESLKLQLAGLRAEPRPDGLALVLGDVFFNSGQGELKAEARQSVQPVMAFLNRHPGKPVRIEGHTDDRGSDAGNLTLSEQRAYSVRDALIAAGASADRLSVVGKGEANPVDSNETGIGRARNRRVEIVIVGAQ